MKVKVNDVALDLPQGTSAIDAVFAAGYDVPYFCSQEFMSRIWRRPMSRKPSSGPSSSVFRSRGTSSAISCGTRSRR